MLPINIKSLKDRKQGDIYYVAGMSKTGRVWGMSRKKQMVNLSS